MPGVYGTWGRWVWKRNTIIAGRATPSFVVPRELPLEKAADGYAHFDAREEGWTKVVLHPGRAAWASQPASS